MYWLYKSVLARHKRKLVKLSPRHDRDFDGRVKFATFLQPNLIHNQIKFWIIADPFLRKRQRNHQETLESKY